MTVHASESVRVSGARSRADERLRRQRRTLRPLGLVVVVVVVATTFGGSPAPGLRGDSLAVTLALCAFVGILLLAIRDDFVSRGERMQAALIAVMGAAGAALTALQPRGSSALAGGAAVWMAFARLPLPLAVPLGVGVTIAVDAAAAIAGSSATAIAAATLLCALLGCVAYFLKEARASQDRTELLLAELEDAREQQLEAAAVTERGRIAGDLHDVLAHSLSGAAIQLEGARKLAQRDGANAEVRTAIERAGELVRDGLSDARRAVGALRGEEPPGVAQLESLIARFCADTGIAVTFSLEGDARALPADAGLALYRGAQEALTNVARYAPGADATVLLHYGSRSTSLSICNGAGESPSRGVDLQGVGGGRGLAGLRERVERAGGTMTAGPTESGWRVQLEVPG